MIMKKSETPRRHTCCYDGNEFGAEIAVARKSAGVGVEVLEVSRCDTLLRAQVVRILGEAEKRVAEDNSGGVTAGEPRPHLVPGVTDGPYPHVLGQKVGEDPAHLRTRDMSADCCGRCSPSGRWGPGGRRPTLHRPSFAAISSTAAAFGSSISSRLFWVAFWNIKTASGQRPSARSQMASVAEDADLGRLVDGSHLGSDAQRDVCVLGVSPVQVAHPLVARLPPEVQETVGDGVVLKHDVVHVSVFLGERQHSFDFKGICASEMGATVTHLSVQRDGAGLTLGADPLGPGRVTLAARLDLTADVLQRCKLSSEEESHHNSSLNEHRRFYWDKKKKDKSSG